MESRKIHYKQIIFFLIIALAVTTIIGPGDYGNNKTYADTPVSFTVKFDLNGGTGSIPDKTVSGGSVLGELPHATKTGYMFEGWFTAAGEQILSTTKIYKDMTLIARWTPNKYIISFDATGGKVKTKKKEVTFDASYGKLPSPTKNRSVFKGWYTSKKGGTKITSNSKVGYAGNQTLYAKWSKAKKVKYTFNGNLGKVSKKSKSYKYNSKFKKLPTPKRKGYTFMGWYTAKRGGQRIYNGKKVTTTLVEDTLYARWAPKRFKQSDSRWGGIGYGGGDTIASAGCGPTTMAMVVSTLKDTKVTPKQAAGWSLKNGYKTSARGKTKDAFFIKYPKKYGIKVTKINKGDIRNMSPSKARKYHNKAYKAVKEGNWVICFMGPGHWAKFGHFVLWYDVIGNNALIRDPSGRNEKSRAKNKVSKLRKTVIRYYVIEVPASKRMR